MEPKNGPESKKFILSFPVELADKPLTYHLVKDYDLVVNILQARINPREEETGRLVVELSGEEQNLRNGIEFLVEQGVHVESHTRDIVWNVEECVHCGACTGVCHPRALALNPETWTMTFDRSKCIVCGICVDACSVGAIEIEF